MFKKVKTKDHLFVYFNEELIYKKNFNGQPSVVLGKAIQGGAFNLPKRLGKS